MPYSVRAALLTAGILLAAMRAESADSKPPVDKAAAPITLPPQPPTKVAETQPQEPEVPLPSPSDAGRVRLDRARDSIVQIRGFFGDSTSDAFHGSGFAVASADGNEGLIVTNYHVVSEAVLYPKQYRLEYQAADGRTGKLQVYAVDVEHDLAAVKGADFAPPPLKLRTQIPNKGERAYSIGFPLDLGLTITEGVANGLVENTLEQRIHFSGPINPGMSGGPALDANGAVYGINVSVSTGKQSVAFVVPAKHLAPLLARATTPLNPGKAREQVGGQLQAHQSALFASLPSAFATQVSSGYVLPGKLAPNVECNSDGSADPSNPLRLEAIACAARVSVFVERGLDVGDFRYQHRVLESDRLSPFQFSDRLNRVAAIQSWYSTDRHVTPFSCNDALVALNGFDAKVNTCVRQYRMFAGLYDIGVTVVSINLPLRAAVSNLELRGVSFELGMDFVRRYLGAMQWTP